MNKKLLLLLVVASAFIVIGFSFSQHVDVVPTPNQSWTLLFNEADEAGDWKSADWICARYGAVRTPIAFTTVVMEEEDYNNAGQNLIVIGASKYLAIQAPWTTLKPSWYNIAEPDVYTRISFSMQNGKMLLQTPQTTYTLDSENDIGVIIRGLDLKLRRWVIIAVGYTVWGTAYAAKLLCTSWTTIMMSSYTVFKCTQHPQTNPSTWQMEQFDGLILEQGI